MAIFRSYVIVYQRVINDVSLEAWKASSGICSDGQDGRHIDT